MPQYSRQAQFSEGVLHGNSGEAFVRNILLSGTWAYVAGSGTATVVVPAGGKVIGIAMETAASPGTIIINGGSTVPVPASSTVEIDPSGNLVAPTIVFDTSSSYFVEYVT